MTGLQALLLAAVLLAAGSIIWSTLKLGIGPMPTSRAVRAVMLELCASSGAGTAYELGSGWGGLARAMGRRFPAMQVIGVEASFVPWLVSSFVQWVAPVPNVRFVRGSFYAQPLGEADLLVTYLFTGGMGELASRLRLKPGATLISAVFALPGHPATDTVRATDMYASPVYRYRG